jgi:membrane protease YdiL (CAAX protease family)
MSNTQPEKMGQAFLDLANQGKTRWGMYLIGFFVIGCIWLLGSLIFIALIFGSDFLSVTPNREPMDGSRPIPDFIALCLTFFALIIGIWLTVCRLHHRPFLSLITPYKTIRWHRVWQGFKWQIACIILSVIIEELIYPGTYTYTLDPAQFYTFAILVLVFIPFQAASEEFLFRGYLLQALGHLIRNPLMLILLNGLGFMALHSANPEIEHGLPSWLAYFAWGAFLTLITLKDNGAELAIGIHVANNVFTGIFTNYEGSALATNTVFTAQELHAWLGFFSYILTTVAMYWILFRNHIPEPLPQPDIETSDIPISSPIQPETSAPKEH